MSFFSRFTGLFTSSAPREGNGQDGEESSQSSVHEGEDMDMNGDVDDGGGDVVGDMRMEVDVDVEGNTPMPGSETEVVTKSRRKKDKQGGKDKGKGRSVDEEMEDEQGGEIEGGDGEIEDDEIPAPKSANKRRRKGRKSGGSESVDMRDSSRKLSSSQPRETVELQEASAASQEEEELPVPNSVKKKRRRGRSRKASTSQSREAVDVQEGSAALGEGEERVVSKSARSKMRRSKSRKSSTQSREAVEIQEEIMVVEEEDIRPTPRSAKDKKHRNRKLSSHGHAERTQEIEETPAPRSNQTKPHGGRSPISEVQIMHNTSPEVRIEKNSAVLFPQDEIPSSNTKHKRQSGDKKKRKRVVDSDEEVSSQIQVEELQDELPEIIENHSSKRKRKNRDGKKRQKLVESDEDMPDLQTEESFEEHVSRFEAEPSPGQHAQMQESVSDAEDDSGHEDLSGGEDLEAEEEDGEDQNAMVTMLNSAIRRGKAPKVPSPAKHKTVMAPVPSTKTLTPILPPAKASAAILPPLPAWKTQIASQSKPSIHPNTAHIRPPASAFRQATPLWQPPRLTAMREASSSPAPIRPDTVTKTPALPLNSSQTVAPPSRSSTPILPPSKSQVILPPSRAATPIVPPRKSQSIHPPSTPIIPSSQSQASLVSRPTTPAVSSMVAEPGLIRPSSNSTTVLPVSRTPGATVSSSKSQSSILPPSKFRSPILPGASLHSSSSDIKLPVDTPSKPESEVFSPSTPQVIIRSRPRPSLLSKIHFATSKSRSPAPLSPQPASLPDKLVETKKTKSKKVLSHERVVHEDESISSAVSSRKSPTPEPLHPLYGNKLLETSDTETSSDGEQDDINEAPQQPSEKALGKRKAVDEPQVRPAQKKQTRRESTASSSDIRRYVIKLSAHDQSSFESDTRSNFVNWAAHKMKDRSLSSTPAHILPGSKINFADSRRAVAPHLTTTAASTNGSRASSTTSILPPFVASLGFQRRSTPQFTPVNKSPNPKSLYSPAVVLPSSSHLVSRGLKSLKYVSSKHHAKRELEPTSSVSAVFNGAVHDDTEMVDADADMILPISDGSQESANSSEGPSESEDHQEPVIASEDSSGLGDDQEEHENQIQSKINSASPPRSDIRRKRRLPIGEDDTTGPQPTDRSLSKVPISASAKSASSAKANVSTLRETRVRGVSKDDAATIKEAVSNFGLQHDMEQDAMNAYIQVTGDATKDEFWNEICTQVPHIPKHTVQNYCRRAFHNFIRGSWSQEQDEELADAYQRFPNKWGKISELVNRSAEHARIRYRDYVALANTQKTEAWDMEEEDRLRQVHADYLDLIRREMEKPDNPKDKKTNWTKVADPESLIDWTIVSQKMGNTRSRLQCFTKWKVLQAREAEERENLNPVGSGWRVRAGVDAIQDLKPERKLQFLRAIRDSGAGSAKRIPWTTISNELDMKGKRMALKVCLRNLMVNVPNHENMTLQAIVSSLIYTFEAASPYEPRGFDKVDKTVQAALEVKSKKKKPSKYIDEGFAARQGVDNGEGSSKKPPRKSPKSKRRVTPTQSEEEDEPEVPVTERTGKIRERMKRADEDHSQETPHPPNDDVEDLEGELKTAWASVTPKAKAKKPIFVPKISQRKKIRQYLSESEDGSDLVVRTNGLDDGDAMQVDEEIASQILDNHAESEESHEDDIAHTSNHEVEKDERSGDGTSESRESNDEDSQTGSRKSMLANGFIDEEAEETSDDDSVQQRGPFIGSDAVVKSEDMDQDSLPFGDQEIVEYSDNEEQNTNFPSGNNSTSSDSGSESDESAMINGALQQQDEVMEDVNPIAHSDSSSNSDSGSDSDANQATKPLTPVKREFAVNTPRMDQSSSSESESESGEDSVDEEDVPSLPLASRQSPPNRSQPNGIHEYTSPTIKVNSSSPVANGTTINSYHSSGSSVHGQDNQSLVGDLNDANEHTITMNGWGELPKVMDSSSSDDSSSEDEWSEAGLPNGTRDRITEDEASDGEQLSEPGLPPMRQESFESSGDEQDIVDPEQNFMQEDDAEMSDEVDNQREIPESELHLPHYEDRESLVDEQITLESERDIIQEALSSPAAQDEPALHSSSKPNGYSLGSAWERTRRVLERDDDGEISISSDDTTSSIPAVAAPKVKLARSESVEM